MTDKNPNKFLNVVAAIFLIGFTFFILKELQSILLPFFIAVIISFVFLPLYNLLVSKKIPGTIAIIVVLLIILIISNISSLVIYTSINAFSEQFPKYELKILQMYEGIITKFNLSPDQVENLNHTFDVKSMLMGGKFTSAITSIFSGITGLMGNYILIIFYIIFLITETQSIKERMALAFPDKNQDDLKKTFNDIFSGVKDYIAGKTLLSFIQAVVIGLFLWICGVDFYFIWAFLFFFSDFIPNVGSLFVSILVMIVMLLQFDNIVTPIIILVVLIVIQNLKGNIIEPRIFGAKLDLSPLLLFLSLVFWGYIWGIVGMILSVPIMSMIKIILMNFKQTKPIAILMSYNQNTGNKKS
ncbi:MAG TPA: AI-2E family transporter [Ignavibacteria bacterium]|nr:AI-2E family transporter [Ignavibacteria bacterium]